MSQTNNIEQIRYSPEYESFITDYMTQCNTILNNMNIVMRNNMNTTNIDIIRYYFENTNIILNAMSLFERILRNNTENNSNVQRPLERQNVNTQPLNINYTTRTTQPMQQPNLLRRASNIINRSPIQYNNLTRRQQPYQNRNIIPITYYTSTTTTSPLQNFNDIENSLMETLMRPFMDSFMEPIPIIPTSEQIANATIIYTFNNDNNVDNSSNNVDNSSNNTCPIDLLPFNNGDEIMKILHCGHSFRSLNLIRWFNQSHTCPVCRYDIRNYVSDENTNQNDNDNDNDTEQEITN